jgi:hypothetical protein
MAAEHTRKSLGGKKGRHVWKGPVYDCQQCGACCTNQEYDPAVGYVCLTKDESKLMRCLGLTVVRAGGSSLLRTRDREGASNPSCVALRGRVGGALPLCHLPVPAHELSQVRGWQQPV